MTTATTTAPRAAARERTPIADVVRFCVLVFVVLRVLTFIAALGAGRFPSLVSQGVPGWAAPPVHPGWADLFSAFERFDALWFLRIAASGYRFGDGSAAFFPLFPLATGAASFATGGHPYLAATIVSNGAFVAALVALFRLTEDELGHDVARWSVPMLALFPTAYFFVFPYSESLFVLGTVVAFAAARRRSWAVAAIAAALAAMTRSVGVMLVPALAIEAWHQQREGRGSAGPGVLAAGGAALGILTYAGWWQVRSGDWLIPLVRQQSWQRAFSWPWATLWNAGRIAWQQWGSPGGGYWVFDLAVVLPVLALAVVAAVRLRPSYAIYVWGCVLAPMTFVFAGRPLMSMPRFVLTLFPLAWIAALGTRGRTAVRWAILGASGVALVVVCAFTIDWFYVF